MDLPKLISCLKNCRYDSNRENRILTIAGWYSFFSVELNHTNNYGNSNRL